MGAGLCGRRRQRAPTPLLHSFPRFHPRGPECTPPFGRQASSWAGLRTQVVVRCGGRGGTGWGARTPFSITILIIISLERAGGRLQGCACPSTRSNLFPSSDPRRFHRRCCSACWPGLRCCTGCLVTGFMDEFDSCDGVVFMHGSGDHDNSDPRGPDFAYKWLIGVGDAGARGGGLGRHLVSPSSSSSVWKGRRGRLQGCACPSARSNLFPSVHVPAQAYTLARDPLIRHAIYSNRSSRHHIIRIAAINQATSPLARSRLHVRRQSAIPKLVA